MIRKETNPIESYFSRKLVPFKQFDSRRRSVRVLGTMYPLFSEALTGVKVNVGPPYFTKVMAPIMFALIVLMAVCPVDCRQKAKVKRFIKTGQWPFCRPCRRSCPGGRGVEGPFAIIGLGAAVLCCRSCPGIYVWDQARRKVTKVCFPPPGN